MHRLWKLCLVLALAFGICVLSGCKKETAEVSVPLLETAVGNVLEEEEVVLLLEGEAESRTYTRIQGNGEFSVAYDPEQFSVQVSEGELCLESLEFRRESETPVFVRFWTEKALSSEELVEQLVVESNEECIVEEITVGEGEYPAARVSFSEGTAADSRTCDYYVLRHNEQLYVVQMECFWEAYEGLGVTQQMMLSTLRFYEG